MSLCTVAELRSALGVGTLYPDATLQQSCDAADLVLIPMLWANNYFNIATSNTTTEGTAYFNEIVTNIFYVGQTVVISGNEGHNNGSKTITAVGADYITFNIAGTPAAKDKHPVNPYGTVTLAAHTDWTLDSAIQEAALMIAVDIWQARQTTSSGGSAVDFQPSPWKMGSSLLAKVRGLIAHALDPRGMVG